MGMTDVGGVPAVQTYHSGEANGFGGMGFFAGLVVGELFNRNRGLADTGINTGIAIAEQSTLLTNTIASATALTNKYVADANVANLQGLAGVSAQICADGRASDQLVFNQTAALAGLISCGNKELLLATLQGDAGIQASICNLGHRTDMGFKDTQLQIAVGNKDIQLQAAQDTCKIITAIHGDGEATRTLITKNTIEALKDEIAELRAGTSESKLLNEINHIKTTQTNLAVVLGTLVGSINQGNANTPTPAAIAAATRLAS